MNGLTEDREYKWKSHSTRHVLSSYKLLIKEVSVVSRKHRRLPLPLTIHHKYMVRPSYKSAHFACGHKKNQSQTDCKTSSLLAIVFSARLSYEGCWGREEDINGLTKPWTLHATILQYTSRIFSCMNSSAPSAWSASGSQKRASDSWN